MGTGGYPKRTKGQLAADAVREQSGGSAVIPEAVQVAIPTLLSSSGAAALARTIGAASAAAPVPLFDAEGRPTRAKFQGHSAV